MSERSEDLKKVGDLIKGIRFAILNTLEADGNIHSRPMTMMEYEFSGELWFFTPKSTSKVDEVNARPRVSVAFASPDKDDYVCLQGSAEHSMDRAKMEELYSPFLKAWFPGGLEDPELSLLKVTVDKAEYWDGPGKLVQMFTFAKAAIFGAQQGDDGGEHDVVTLR
jgi:general stress protein 26